MTDLLSARPRQRTVMLGAVIRGAALAAMMLGLGAGAAKAQEFKNEAKPLFDNCGDPSYQKAVSDGITIGISPSPPFTSINPSTQKAEGLEVELNEAALAWMGVTKIHY